MRMTGSIVTLLAMGVAAVAQVMPPPTPNPMAPPYTVPGRLVLSHEPRTAAFYNSATGVGVAKFPQNTYVEIDVAKCETSSDPCVPIDATGVIMSALLIITQGGEVWTTDVTANVKSPTSAQSCWNYLGQTVETSPTGGQRSPWFAVAPVVNGKIKFCRNTLRLGSFYEPPIGGPLAFGINMRIVGYVIP